MADTSKYTGCGFLSGWPGECGDLYPCLANGDTMEVNDTLTDQPPMFFMGTVRSNSSLGRDMPVPHAQVTVWVSNDEDSEEERGHWLGAKFTCDSHGDFWFQAVAPEEYTVLRPTEDGTLESFTNPPHFSFEASHPNFKGTVSHIFVAPPEKEKKKKSKKKEKKLPPNVIRTKIIDDPAEARRRGCQNPFVDVHCDVMLSLEPKDDLSWDIATAIMDRADGFSKNQSLSVSELGTFLRGTEHEPFAMWLLYNREKNFKKFDVNKDGTISLRELVRAIKVYNATHSAEHKYYY